MSQYIVSILLVYLSGVDLGVYGTLMTAQIVFTILGMLTLATGSIRASRTIHDNMLANMLRSPLAFFDTTPIGRIVNRFSKVWHGSTVVTSLSLYQDMYTIDDLIPVSIQYFLSTVFSVLTTLIIVTIASPWFLLVMAPLAIIYMIIQVPNLVA